MILDTIFYLWNTGHIGYSDPHCFSILILIIVANYNYITYTYFFSLNLNSRPDASGLEFRFKGI